MFPLDPPQDEIDRVLAHPLPAGTFRFDAVAFRERLARSVAYTEKGKHELIDGSVWLSRTQAARILRHLRAVERAKATWVWANISGHRPPLCKLT